MLTQTVIDRIAEEIIERIQGKKDGTPETRPDHSSGETGPTGASIETRREIRPHADTACEQSPCKLGKRNAVLCETSQSSLKGKTSAPLLEDPQDARLLASMLTKTTARIGVGRCGPRLKTATLLKLRADHAAARDAVLMDVDEALIDRLGLLKVQTMCRDKDEFLTRPDLGRDFDEKTRRMIREKCAAHQDVQFIVSDGLSSMAVEANAAKILPVIQDGLKERGITFGNPVFVKYGRVAAQDRISELVDAKVVCSLIGERPGLATAESLSAYLSYRAAVGMPEARRTVVSNIHKDGVPAVEAGAYIADLIGLLLKQKASGVDLKK